MTSSLFALRSPSEHTLNGKYMDAELQWFYTNINGDKAALAILYDVEDGGDTTSSVFTDILLDVTKRTIYWSNIAYMGPLIGADDLEFIVYNGSYTNPKGEGDGDETTPDPCEEDVSWVVISNV